MIPFTNLFTNFLPLSPSVMTSSGSAKYLLDHFHPHLQSPRLTKTFEVETSRFLFFLLHIFAHIIDFRSYVDATMSLYSINITMHYVANSLVLAVIALH